MDLVTKDLIIIPKFDNHIPYGPFAYLESTTKDK